MVAKIAFVGADSSKWDQKGETVVRLKIRNIMRYYMSAYPNAFTPISGHSPKGGVDIWTEEIAKELGLEMKIFAPEVFAWEDEEKVGYKKRNIMIAEECYILFVFSPSINGKVVWNGGLWTANYAEKIGKKVYRFDISKGGN
jgi:hypothetical protein